MVWVLLTVSSARMKAMSFFVVLGLGVNPLKVFSVWWNIFHSDAGR